MTHRAAFLRDLARPARVESELIEQLADCADVHPRPLSPAALLAAMGFRLAPSGRDDLPPCGAEAVLDVVVYRRDLPPDGRAVALLRVAAALLLADAGLGSDPGDIARLALALACPRRRLAAARRAPLLPLAELAPAGVPAWLLRERIARRARYATAA